MRAKHNFIKINDSKSKTHTSQIIVIKVDTAFVHLKFLSKYYALPPKTLSVQSTEHYQLQISLAYGVTGWLNW